MAYTGKRPGNVNTDFLEAGGDLENHDELVVSAAGEIAQTSVTALDTALAGKSDTAHNHSGVYEPADATILKDADIGTSVLAPNGDGSQLQNLPAGGKVLQTAHSTTTGILLRNTATWGAIFSSTDISFTPQSSNSTIILEAHFSYNNGAIKSYIDHFRFWDTTNNQMAHATTSYGARNQATTAFRGASYDNNDASTVTMRAIITNTSTIARTYSVHHRSEYAAQRFFNYSNSNTSTYGWSTPFFFSITEYEN